MELHEYATRGKAAEKQFKIDWYRGRHNAGHRWLLQSGLHHGRFKFGVVQNGTGGVAHPDIIGIRPDTGEVVILEIKSGGQRMRAALEKQAYGYAQTLSHYTGRDGKLLYKSFLVGAYNVDTGSMTWHRASRRALRAGTIPKLRTFTG